MTPETRALITTTITFDSDFYLEYDTILGPLEFYGQRLSEPVPNLFAMDTWEGPYGWRPRMVEASRITRFVSGLEGCPECRERPGNLENISDHDDALCDVCARERWEERHAESLIEDGGI